MKWKISVDKQSNSCFDCYGCETKSYETLFMSIERFGELAENFPDEIEHLERKNVLLPLYQEVSLCLNKTQDVVNFLFLRIREKTTERKPITGKINNCLTHCSRQLKDLINLPTIFPTSLNMLKEKRRCFPFGVRYLFVLANRRKL